MPEGHTLHRLARDLGTDLVDEVVHASSPQGRFSAGAALVDRQQLTKAEARGKHLFLWFDHEVAHVHLGLIGVFRRTTEPDTEPRGQIRLRLATDTVAWDLSGPNVCEIVTPEQASEIAARLGPDPLRRDGTLKRFENKLVATSRPIGAALLDQTVVAGVGNVYRAELLFLEGIHPETRADQLSSENVAALWARTRSQLRRGVRLGRIVTRNPAELKTPLDRAADDERLYAYKRAGEPCRHCDDTIERTMLANRKMWHCPTCQPEPTA